MCTKLHIFNWKTFLAVEKFYTDAVGSVGDKYQLWLDLTAFEDVVISKTLPFLKKEILQGNLKVLLRSKPIDLESARCTSFHLSNSSFIGIMTRHFQISSRPDAAS